MKRFRTIYVDEARKQGLPGINRWDEDCSFLYDFSTDPPVLIASDRMEPEDATFYRDLGWIAPLLNSLVEEKK